MIVVWLCYFGLADLVLRSMCDVRCLRIVCPVEGFLVFVVLVA